MRKAAGKRTSPPAEGAGAAALTIRRTVLWFGNAGGPHSNFGMLSLFHAAPALRAAHAENPLTLVIISSDRARYEAISAGIGVPSRFAQWSAETVHQELKGADVTLITTGDDRFSLVKSANRAVLSLEAGVPVVCTPSPSLEPLKHCVETDYEQGLRKYLTDKAAGAADVALAREVIAREFAIERIVQTWEAVLAEASARGAAERGSHCQRPIISFLIDLVQDFDVLLPVIDEAGVRGLTRYVIASQRAFEEEPRLAGALIDRGIVPTMIEPGAAGRLDARYLRDSDVLVMGAESSQPPHRIAHELSTVASRQGLRSASIQHGLEMPGLTMATSKPVTFNSDVIFIWGAIADLPDFLTDDVRARCKSVGRPRAQRPLACENVEPHRLRVGIFENLHWERYTAQYRRAFEITLNKVARLLPDVTFALRPHPAGRWTMKQPDRFHFPNIYIADPKDTCQGVDAFIAGLDAVITTPSTVSLDAMEARKPTAIFAGDLRNLDAYAPLPLLHNVMDWLAFVENARSGAHLGDCEQFIERLTIPGDGSSRIIDALCGTAWPVRMRARVSA